MFLFFWGATAVFPPFVNAFIYIFWRIPVLGPQMKSASRADRNTTTLLRCVSCRPSSNNAHVIQQQVIARVILTDQTPRPPANSGKHFLKAQLPRRKKQRFFFANKKTFQVRPYGILRVRRRVKEKNARVLCRLRNGPRACSNTPRR